MLAAARAPTPLSGLHAGAAAGALRIGANGAPAFPSPSWAFPRQTNSLEPDAPSPNRAASLNLPSKQACSVTRLARPSLLYYFSLSLPRRPSCSEQSTLFRTHPCAWLWASPGPVPVRTNRPRPRTRPHACLPSLPFSVAALPFVALAISPGFSLGSAPGPGHARGRLLIPFRFLRV